MEHARCHRTDHIGQRHRRSVAHIHRRQEAVAAELGVLGLSRVQPVKIAQIAGAQEVGVVDLEPPRAAGR